MIFFGPGFASPFQEALREARAPVHMCHILPVGGKAESRVLPCNCFRVVLFYIKEDLVGGAQVFPMLHLYLFFCELSGLWIEAV